MWKEYRLLFYSALIGVVGGLGAQLFVWLLNFSGKRAQGVRALTRVVNSSRLQCEFFLGSFNLVFILGLIFASFRLTLGANGKR